jgi:tRNA A-37 threonylcarbamoyl transferase component Bud32
VTSDDAPILLSDQLIGSQVGEYTVVEAVGEGGMGVVYRGVQPVIKKRVAIKVLKPGAAEQAQQVKRLISEAEAVNAIGHRGIIDIFSLGELPDGRPYIVMEFLEGEPLDVWLKRLGRPPLLEVLEVLLEVCAPLQAAHLANVVHRDLKPSNVFLCRQLDGSRYVKLLDFGLAKRIEGMPDPQQTNPAFVAGTPDYIAPEQARGLEVSPRTDLYALGVMTYQLLTGKLPFTGQTSMDVVMAHVSRPAPRVSESWPEVPRRLDLLVAQLLAKDPEKRPANVAALRAELEAIVREAGGTPPARTSLTSTGLRALNPSEEGPAAVTELAMPATRPAPRWPRRLALGLGALLLAGAAAAYLLTAGGERDEAAGLAAPLPAGEARAGPDGGSSPDALAGGEAGAELAALPAGAGDPDAGRLANVKPPGPPATKVLLERMARLERRAKHTPSFDPSALPLLQRLRLKLKADDTPMTRRKVSADLDQWERAYLH